MGKTVPGTKKLGDHCWYNGSGTQEKFKLKKCRARQGIWLSIMIDLFKYFLTRNKMDLTCNPFVLLILNDWYHFLLSNAHLTTFLNRMETISISLSLSLSLFFNFCYQCLVLGSHHFLITEKASWLYFPTLAWSPSNLSNHSISPDIVRSCNVFI